MLDLGGRLNYPSPWLVSRPVHSCVSIHTKQLFNPSPWLVSRPVHSCVSIHTKQLFNQIIKTTMKQPQIRNSHMDIGEVYFYTSTIVSWKKLFKTENLKTIITDCLKNLVERKLIIVYSCQITYI
jgi:hypothetical protein